MHKYDSVYVSFTRIDIDLAKRLDEEVRYGHAEVINYDIEGLWLKGDNLEWLKANKEDHYDIVSIGYKEFDADGDIPDLLTEMTKAKTAWVHHIGDGEIEIEGPDLSELIIVLKEKGG